MNDRMPRRDLLTAGLGLAGLAATGANASETQPARAGSLAQEFSVVFRNSDPKLYVEGPGLTRLSDGSLFAVVPTVLRSVSSAELRPTHSHVQMLRSEDGGKSWQPASRLPYYSARAWEHAGILYLFAFQPGTKHRNDDLHLLRSRDGGRTWTDAVTLFKGHFWNCHTSMVIRGMKAYWVVDDIGNGLREERTHRVIAGDLSGDPMDPKAWRMSDAAKLPAIPDVLANPRFGKYSSQMLEPNLIDVKGQLRILSTVKIHNQTTAGLCVVHDVNDSGEKFTTKFVQFHPMPGGQLKFCVLWDEQSKLFWATANLVVDGQGRFDWWRAKSKNVEYRGGSTGGNDRRLLMLLYGMDGLNWFQAGCVAQARKVTQSFMYAAPAVDGDDLAIIARSSISAPDQHDADHATFHRVRNFRHLALNLLPESEG